jgi:hypothetical protein
MYMHEELTVEGETSKGFEMLTTASFRVPRIPKTQTC